MARDEGRTYEVDIITLPDGRTFAWRAAAEAVLARLEKQALENAS